MGVRTVSGWWWVGVVLAVVGSACGGAASVEGSTDAVGSGSGADGGGIDAGDVVETDSSGNIADCLLMELSGASFVLRFDPAAVVERDGSVASGWVLRVPAGSLATNVLIRFDWVPLEDLVSPALDRRTLVDELERLSAGAESTGDLVLVGRRRLGLLARDVLEPAAEVTAIVDLGGPGVSAFDPCTNTWRDITVEMGAAVEALGVDGPLEALAAVAQDSHAPARLDFAEAWADALDHVSRPAWTGRDPAVRSYVDADVPPEVRERLVPWRVLLTWSPDPGTVDGGDGGPFAVCPRQATALSGCCIPLDTLRLGDVVLEIAVDPSQPVEFWLHDERTDPSGAVGPLLVVEDLGAATAISVNGAPTTPNPPADAGAAAATIDLRATPANPAVLDDPAALGLPLVGGFGIVPDGP